MASLILRIMYHPKISIVIPVYNGANFLREAVDSALAQTYANFEILVVNDGSSDGGATRAIAESYGDKIRYFEKSNGGVSSALNFGIKQMTGEFFSWLSHDDLYLPQKLENQVHALNELPAEKRSKTILYSDFQLIDHQSRPFREVRFGKLHSKEQLNHRLFPVLNGLLHGCTLLIPRQAFEIGMFDEDLRQAQDEDLWFLLFQHFDVLHKSEVLVGSRVHPMQDSKNEVHSARRLDELDRLWMKIYASVSESEMIELEGSCEAFYKKSFEFLEKAHGISALNLLFQQWRAHREHAKVSVIVPFHNEIISVMESCNSALSQTYKHVEVVLVDYGSTEGTKPLLDLASRESRIVFRKSSSPVWAAACNEGVRAATGDFLCWLEPGDRFAPDKVEKQLHFMQLSGSPFTYSAYLKLNDDGVPFGLAKVPTRATEAGLLRGKESIAASTVMAKRSILVQHPFIVNGFPWAGLVTSNEAVGIQWPLSEVRNRPDASGLRRAALKKVHFAYWLLEEVGHAIESLKDKGIRVILKPIFNRLPINVQLSIRRAL
jgi:glycosyltransferase involved in cell wall biosynthesis